MNDKMGVIILLFMLFCGVVRADPQLERTLHNDIKQAQQTLNQTEQRVSTERTSLITQINDLAREVLALQQKTVLARRFGDEKTLSLTQLEQRLDGWRQQQSYQHDLLDPFLRQHGQAAVSVPDHFSAKMAAVVRLSQGFEQRFTPTWQQQRVINNKGEQQSMATLTLGPVVWFWQTAQQLAGLANVDKQGLTSAIVFDQQVSQGIGQLVTEGKGTVRFDPTLNRALVREQQRESVFEHVAKGGIWVLPILLFGLFALSIGILKSIQLGRLAKVATLDFEQLQTLNHSLPLTIKGMQRQLLIIARDETTPRVRDDRLFVQLQQDKRQLVRWIGAIAVCASISPLLGLLGTVSGMIETFKMMTLFGSGDAEVVSGGIAQALVTTELGLVVAIPALILHALLNRRAQSYYQNLENFAVLLSQPMAVQTANEPAMNHQSQPSAAHLISQGALA